MHSHDELASLTTYKTTRISNHQKKESLLLKVVDEKRYSHLRRLCYAAGGGDFAPHEVSEDVVPLAGLRSGVQVLYVCARISPL